MLKHPTIKLIIAGIIMCFSTVQVYANTAPPSSTVKLIFIHHSTGGNWLADVTTDYPSGGLGKALMDNNYYVSATNYSWGPNAIGDNTDGIYWNDWFYNTTVMTAVYNEKNQNIGDFGAWSRIATDPGGENQIIMFKSCFPNSNLYGNPTDPAASSINQDFTVSNFKAIYNNLLTYFAAHQDKLFVVITAPPMSQTGYIVADAQTPASSRAANARAFTKWLVNDWLKSYSYKNVAVFDYYNVLTSNGGGTETNDAGQAAGNHHRWWNGQVQHIQSTINNYSAYPMFEGEDYADDHPTSAGHRKATAEFVPLLNYFYNTWKSQSSNVLGDIDGNNTVNLADLIITLQIICGYNVTSINLNADVNNDGKIGIKEGCYILWKIANL